MSSKTVPHGNSRVRRQLTDAKVAASFEVTSSERQKGSTQGNSRSSQVRKVSSKLLLRFLCIFRGWGVSGDILSQIPGDISETSLERRQFGGEFNI